MKKRNNYSKTRGPVQALALCLLLAFASCGGGDDVIPRVDIVPYVITVEENPTADQVLGTIASKFGSVAVEYVIENQQPDGAIAIDQTTGELSVAVPALFDFETDSQLVATISARVDGGRQSAQLLVNLEDVAETVTANPFSITIDENPTTTLLGTLSATSDGDASISYQLIAGEDASAFSVDAATGELSVADYAQFDYELNTTLTATFEADNGVATSQSTITVTLTDLDDSSVGMVTNLGGFQTAQSAAAVVFLDKMWIIGGLNGSESNRLIFNSEDGRNWTAVDPNVFSDLFTKRNNHTLTVFQGRLWLIGGRGGSGNNTRYSDVYSTADGVNWTLETASAPFGQRDAHSTIVFDNKLWVIAGNTSPNGVIERDVFSSADGISWTEEVSFGPFTGRLAHTSLVFDNKMWILGGRGNTASTDMIWSSSDGVNWTQVTPTGGITPRSGHTSVVFDNKMWIIGGGSEEAWSSVDGTNWVQETVPAFSGRREHCTLVYDGKIWLLGGFDSFNGNNKNDVWILAE